MKEDEKDRKDSGKGKALVDSLSSIDDFELEELEKRLEMQRIAPGALSEAGLSGCYADACDQVCDVYCSDYTGCVQDCLCNLEDCFDKCGTDCLVLCYAECLADCGFCAGDW